MGKRVCPSPSPAPVLSSFPDPLCHLTYCLESVTLIIFPHAGHSRPWLQSFTLDSSDCSSLFFCYFSATHVFLSSHKPPDHAYVRTYLLLLCRRARNTPALFIAVFQRSQQCLEPELAPTICQLNVM